MWNHKKNIAKMFILLGNFTISVNGSSERFLVEEYKRPTYEVSFDEVTGKVKIGDSLKITGKVKAFAGYTLSNSKVKSKVLK